MDRANELDTAMDSTSYGATMTEINLDLENRFDI